MSTETNSTTNKSFVEWLEDVAGHFIWRYPHQTYLFKKLDEVTRGDATRMMIFMPPRHAKSETVTIRYAAWRLIREPHLRIIIGCYNQHLANRFSRSIRRIAEDNGVKLMKDHRSTHEWETTSGGGVKAVGVGAGITGFGGHLIIIDDPVKSRGAAESIRRRDSVWDWYTDDLYTRLEPGGALILIQTRWHIDDLAGRLQVDEKDGGDKWTVVELPAFARDNDPIGRKPGEALWPERFDREALERVRRLQGDYAFESLYQQRPVPAAGNIFKRAWFTRIIDAAPKGLRWARGWDLAVSTKTSADNTATFRCAFDDNGDLYIDGGIRKKIEFPEQRALFRHLALLEKDTVQGIEKALHGLALAQEMMKDPALRGVSITSIAADRDKVTRANLWSGRAAAGKVVLVNGPWIADFLDEVCSFPAGRYDDQVDAVSLAVTMLAKPKYSNHGF